MRLSQLRMTSYGLFDLQAVPPHQSSRMYVKVRLTGGKGRATIYKIAYKKNKNVSRIVIRHHSILDPLLSYWIRKVK